MDNSNRKKKEIPGKSNIKMTTEGEMEKYIPLIICKDLASSPTILYLGVGRVKLREWYKSYVLNLEQWEDMRGNGVEKGVPIGIMCLDLGYDLFILVTPQGLWSQPTN